MIKSPLHELADEKVSNVYERNEHFDNLLVSYYEKPSKKVRDELWIIMFQCACNFLKKKFGKWWSYEKIEEVALDICMVLFGRIDNKTKWPEGYRIINLPRMVEFAFLCVYYKKNVRTEREKVIYSLEQMVEMYGDKFSNFMKDTEDFVEEENFEEN